MLDCASTQFGGPIEEKFSDLKGCYVANLYCLRLGRLGNAWNEVWMLFETIQISVALQKGRSQIWKAAM